MTTKPDKKKSIIIEKNGHRVSITPNTIRVKGESYETFRIRATILGERITQSAPTLEKAEEKAKALLAQIKAKGGVIATYTPQQVAVIESALETCMKAGVTLTQAATGYAEAAKYLPEGISLVEAVRGYANRVSKESVVPISVSELVKKYMDSINDRSTVHRKTIGLRLGRAGSFFNCDVGDVTAEQVDQWLQSLEVGPLTKNHHRTALVSLFRYAQKKNHLPKGGMTEAEGSDTAKGSAKAIEAYTPAEAAYLLANIEERWLSYVAIGLFAGIRPQEIFNLSWEDIKSDHIEVKASGSKVGLRRIVPLLPNLSSWLAPLRADKGPVCPVFVGGDVSRAQSLSKAMRAVVEKAKEEAAKPTATKQQKELAASFAVIFDGLRHSFISYRVAIVKDFPQVAMEAGNSVEVIQSHYNKRATEKEANQYFSITKGKAKNILQMRQAQAA